MKFFKIKYLQLHEIEPTNVYLRCLQLAGVPRIVRNLFFNHTNTFNMDLNTLKILVSQSEKFLPADEFQLFRKQVNEVYLQGELKALYSGMPIDREMESWRSERIMVITKQLSVL